MFAVVTCNSSMASCTLCQYPLVYDAITNTNPHKFVKKVTYSRSAQYFNVLISTKFYLKKESNHHFLKKSKCKCGLIGQILWRHISERSYSIINCSIFFFQVIIHSIAYIISKFNEFKCFFFLYGII